MEKSGWVYALLNPSMPELVKIGKTTKDPRERARQLSAETGVPTPFTVIYQEFFADVDEAESHVHTFLESWGYRLSPNREFFEADTTEVIKAISATPGKIEPNFEGSTEEIIEEYALNESSIGDDELDEIDLGDYSPPNEGDLIFDEAEKYFNGEDDYIEDYEEALKLYHRAAKLGSKDAFYRLGQIYCEGLGFKENKKKGIDYLKEGARKGNIFCYHEMAKLFLTEYAATLNSHNKANALKLWKRFFEEAEMNPTATIRGGVMNLPSAIFEYLNFWVMLKEEGGYDVEGQPNIFPIVNELKSDVEEWVNRYIELTGDKDIKEKILRVLK